MTLFFESFQKKETKKKEKILGVCLLLVQYSLFNKLKYVFSSNVGPIVFVYSKDKKKQLLFILFFILA